VKKVLVMMILAGCNQLAPTYYVSHRGVEYHADTDIWAGPDIESEESHIFAALASTDLDPACVAKAATQTEVYPLEGESFECPAGATTVRCAGMEFFQYVTVAAKDGPRGSALGHELLHWLLFRCRDTFDSGHATKYWTQTGF
jgi:hypothetical protein